MRADRTCPASTCWRINVTGDGSDDLDVQERAPRRARKTTTMRLLEQRVPLTLLLDLLQPPDAEELYEREGGNAADWIPTQRL